MKALQNILAPYVKAQATGMTLGPDEPGAPAGPTRAVDRLTDRLRGLSRRNERYFWICVVLLVIVLLASLGFVVLFREQPAAIAGVFAALGASAYGGVWQMVKLWREKLATDVAIEILAFMPLKDALELINDKILTRLK